MFYIDKKGKVFFFTTLSRFCPVFFFFKRASADTDSMLFLQDPGSSR